VDPHTKTSPSEAIADDALNAAHAAASLRPLAIRVAELETILAVEREEHARRLKEIDGLSRTMRLALQNLQSDLRRVTCERDELAHEREERERDIEAMRERIHALRDRAESAARSSDGATAEVVASAVARAQAADVEVARLKQIVATLRGRVEEVEAGDAAESSSVLEDLDRYQSEMAQRDAELATVAQRLRESERSVRESEDRVRRAELQAAEARSQLEIQTPGRRSAPTTGPIDVAPTFPLMAAPRTFSSDDAGFTPISQTVDDTLGHTAGETVESTHTAMDANPVTQSHSLSRPAPTMPEAYADAGDAAGLLYSENSDSCEIARGSLLATTPEFPGIDAVLGVRPETPGRGGCSARRPAIIPSPAPRGFLAGPLGVQHSASAELELDSSSSSSVSAALGHDDESFPGLRVEREVAASAAYSTLYARRIVGGGAVVVHALADGVAAPDADALLVLTGLRHANLIPLLSYTADSGCRHLVAERAAGERADVWVGRVGQIAERIALAVVLQAARGLAAAASRGVHHGELSPSALWVDPAGGVRVASVGLRALVAEDGPPAHLAYAAPEIRSGGAATTPCDVYSLGATLYFLLTGCAALAVHTDGQCGVPDPRELRGDLSARSARLVALLTATDPSTRPQTWDLALAEIEENVTGGRVDAPVPARAGVLSRRTFTRPHLLVGLLAIPVALTAAVLLVQDGFSPTPRQSFDRTVVRAERLVRLGDVEGARQLYRKFVRDAGDLTVERDARRRIDDLSR